jgi:hypothetical protein
MTTASGGDSGFVSVNVGADNDPPDAVNDAVSTSEGSSVLVYVIGNDGDPDGDSFVIDTFDTQSTHGGKVEEDTVNGEGYLRYTPAPDFFGVDDFTYTIRDTAGLTDTATVKVTVNAVNDAPSLNPIGNKLVDEHSLLEFTATAQDIDTPQAQLEFSLEGAPSGPSITPAGEFSWRPSETQGPLEHTFDVVVRDEHLAEDRETITVTVSEVNTAPVLDAIPSPQTVNEEQYLSFQATASDEDRPSQRLSYTLQGPQVPSGATIDSNGFFEWIPVESQGPGSYTFDVVVRDNFASAQIAPVYRLPFHRPM